MDEGNLNEMGILVPNPHLILGSNSKEASLDLDSPIALRKGICSCCSMHPIAKYVLYRRLSPFLDLLPLTYLMLLFLEPYKKN